MWYTPSQHMNKLSVIFWDCTAGGDDDEEEEQGVTGGIHHDWLEIDRIIAKDKAGRYLVKWRGLGYSEATWESSLMPSDKVCCLNFPPSGCLQAARELYSLSAASACLITEQQLPWSARILCLSLALRKTSHALEVVEPGVSQACIRVLARITNLITFMQSNRQTIKLLYTSSALIRVYHNGGAGLCRQTSRHSAAGKGRLRRQRLLTARSTMRTVCLSFSMGGCCATIRQSACTG